VLRDEKSRRRAHRTPRSPECRRSLAARSPKRPHPGGSCRAENTDGAAASCEAAGGRAESSPWRRNQRYACSMSLTTIAPAEASGRRRILDQLVPEVHPYDAHA